MYDFSLIDRMKNTEPNDHSSSSSSNDDVLSLDLENINNVIHDALHVYNEEVLNVSTINQSMDRLNRKNEKVKGKLNDMTKTISDVSTYISSNYEDEDNPTYKDIIDNIQTISVSIDSCLSNIDIYSENENMKYSEVYNSSLDKINSLFNVFTLAKFNRHSCPICLKNESTHFALPCGHVYCEECSNKISVTCFICRGNIFKVSPLFFS